MNLRIQFLFLFYTTFICVRVLENWSHSACYPNLLLVATLIFSENPYDMKFVV